MVHHYSGILFVAASLLASLASARLLAISNLDLMDEQSSQHRAAKKVSWHDECKNKYSLFCQWWATSCDPYSDFTCDLDTCLEVYQCGRNENCIQSCKDYVDSSCALNTFTVGYSCPDGKSNANKCLHSICDTPPSCVGNCATNTARDPLTGLILCTCSQICRLTNLPECCSDADQCI